MSDPIPVDTPVINIKQKEEKKQESAELSVFKALIGAPASGNQAIWTAEVLINRMKEQGLPDSFRVQDIIANGGIPAERLFYLMSAYSDIRNMVFNDAECRTFLNLRTTAVTAMSRRMQMNSSSNKIWRGVSRL